MAGNMQIACKFPNYQGSYELNVKNKLLRKHKVKRNWIRLVSKGEFPGIDDEKNGHYFSNPSDVALSEDMIIFAIENYKSFIMKISAQGSYISTLGRMGQGPGEFVHPLLADLSEKEELYVMDGSRISVVDENGRFLRSFKQFFMINDFVVSHQYIYANFYYLQEKKSPLIIKMDNTGRIVDVFGERFNIAGHKSLDSVTFLHRFGDQIIAAFEHHPIVRFYSQDGKLLREIKLNLMILEDMEKLNYDKRFNSHKPRNNPVPRLPRLIAGVTSFEDRVFVLLHLPRIEILEIEESGDISKHYYFPDIVDIVNYGHGFLAYKVNGRLQFCVILSVEAKLLFLESPIY
jgi:hypothetical protein